MTATITAKPIETYYNGYHFRSRLEARWAVFFDALDVPYEYEREGYNLDGTLYLPDFWLPEQQAWVEIKGGTPTPDEERKAFLLADLVGYPVVMCSGPIGVKRIDPRYSEYMPTCNTKVYTGFHRPTQFDFCREAFWYFGYQLDDCALYEFLCEQFPADQVPRYDGSRESIFALVELDRRYYFAKYAKEHPHYQFGLTHKGGWDWSKTNQLIYGFLERGTDKHPLLEAYYAAQQARFEHGQKGTSWTS